MIDAKQQVITSIVQARTNLESALADLEKLPAFDPSSVPFTAHALSNFLTVSEGTLDLLSQALPPDVSPEVSRLLNGLKHATDLMTRTVSHLIPIRPSVTSNYGLKKLILRTWSNARAGSTSALHSRRTFA